MRLVYVIYGQTGSGHLAQALACANGLARAKARVDFHIVGASGFLDLAEAFPVTCHPLPMEGPEILGGEGGQGSRLFQLLGQLQADVLIIRSWFVCQHFLNNLPGKKVFLTWQIWPTQLVFEWPHNRMPMAFDPGAWDLVLSTEPQDWDVAGPKLGAKTIPPVVLCNPDELLEPRHALATLGLDSLDRPPRGWCVCAANGIPGEFEALTARFDELEAKGYGIYQSSNHHGGIFPLCTFFRAFEFGLLPGSYNAYWEARFLGLDAEFVTFPRVWEQMERRLILGRDYPMAENGADVLARLIMGL